MSTITLKGPNGIQNNGNTCYVNSFIQCVGYCPSFLDFVMNKVYTTNNTNNKQKPMLDMLSEMYSILWHKENITVNPSSLLHQIQLNLKNIINIYEQNDINEFIMLFLDKLNDEIARELVLPIPDLNKATNDVEKLGIMMKVEWVKSNRKDYSYLKKMFYGQIISQVVCGNCGYIHQNVEMFMNLMIPITGNTLDECLDNYFKCEDLTNWQCSECKGVSLSKRSHRLWKNPDVFIISLKRFSSDLSKINTKVEIPKSLNLQKYTLSPNATINYKLSSSAIQAGSYNSGHYVAMCNHPVHSWKIIDDENITSIKDEHIDDILKQSYVLFYDSFNWPSSS